MKAGATRLIAETKFLREVGVGLLVRHTLRSGPAFAIELVRHARLMRASGLFDRAWYLSAYPAAPAHRALSHFLLHGWQAGNNPGPGFDCAYYAAANPDVAQAGLNPAIHFILHGRAEGRQPLPPPALPQSEPEPDPFSPERLAPVLARFQLDADAAMQALEGIDRPRLRLAPGAPVAVFVHSAGNLFMHEIAELVTAGFAAAGFDASIYDERAAFLAEGDAGAVTRGAARVIVAPHEFFLLPVDGHPVPAEWAAGAILLNVEQLLMSWFRVGLAALRRAAAVLDINLQSAAALAHAGLPAAFLPLGHVADFAPFRRQEKLPDLPALKTLERAIKDTCPAAGAPLAERPIDIFFIGYLSPRRAGILERMAERLSRWRCHFVLTDADSPKVRGKTAVLDTEAAIGLAQRAKIVLNLHQSDEPFFEWHRIVLQGIWQRAAVITEPVAMQAHFHAGEHFLEAPIDELADLIDWALGSGPGMATLERIRARAHEHLSARVRLDETLRAMFLEQAAMTEDALP